MFSTFTQTGTRLGYLVEADCGRSSGHFWNDVGATMEEAAAWIRRRVMNALPEDAHHVRTTLYIDHKPVFSE